jgi:hypothetical protein
MQSTLNLHLKLARDDMATTNFVLTALIRSALRLFRTIAPEPTIAAELFTYGGLTKANSLSDNTLTISCFIHSIDDFTMLFAEAAVDGILHCFCG